MDVTSILLANHFDILTAVEQEFSPLSLPFDLVPALHKMRDAIRPMQPSRLKACRKIVSMVNNGDLQIIKDDESINIVDDECIKTSTLPRSWFNLLAIAAKHNGIIIDFLPKRTLSGENIILPDGTDSHFINCRQLLETLMSQHIIDCEEYEVIINKLGTEGIAAPIGPTPIEGTPLIIDHTILVMISESGMLARIIHIERNQPTPRHFFLG